MTKLKSTKLQLYGVIALALLLGVGSWVGVKAYQSEQAPQNLAEAGGTIVVNNSYEAPSSVGGAGLKELVMGWIQEALQMLNLGAVTGPSLPNPNSTNNLDVYVASKVFIDASTTIFSMPSPFLKVTSTGAGGEVVVKTEGGVSWTSQTTTVDYLNILVTGANTSSIRFDCGASPGPTPLAGVLPVRELVTTTVYLPTSTKGTVENNVSAAQGGSINGGTVAKIMLGSDAPYLVCIATETPHDGSAGLLNPDNTFDGRVKARFINNSR